MPVGLLLLAHGERVEGAGNDCAFRLAADLSSLRPADETRLGFISGTPTIAEALNSFRATHVIVYPLLMSAGYFAQTGFARLRDAQATMVPKRVLKVLPLLGLDPALASIVAVRASDAAASLSVLPSDATLVLIAHGSNREPASKIAAETLAERLVALKTFAAVRVAFLEQCPSLGTALSPDTRPAVIVGLFAGEGRHGGIDIARTIAALERRDVAFAGNAGTWPEIVQIVASAVERGIQSVAVAGMSATRDGDPTFTELPVSSGVVRSRPSAESV